MNAILTKIHRDVWIFRASVRFSKDGGHETAQNVFLLITRCMHVWTISLTMTIESSTNTCAQPDTKSNPNPNPHPNHKQHAIVNIQLNTLYSHMLYISRKIHTRQCCCTVCTNFGCYCQTTAWTTTLKARRWVEGEQLCPSVKPWSTFDAADFPYWPCDESMTSDTDDSNTLRPAHSKENI